MERNEIEKRIKFLKDLMHHWEQDLWMGEITRKEYRDACADAWERIEELEKQLD